MKNNEESQEKLSTVFSGIAGEYFVAAELSRRGYIASITLRNTDGVDVLCANKKTNKSVCIQVKTNRGSNRTWVMNQKSESYFAENLFYVFVNLNDNKKHPDYFIVPSKTASKHITESHSTWLRTPNKKGGAHVDNSMRKFTDPKEEFLDRWDLLGLEANN
ncbi:MAG: aspartate ammonia-lyase [Candidatus Taylorbacteria bacterium]|nr:aspartate ammonia-lyase [Candidatus Taylorbacteria bacterium]